MALKECLENAELHINKFATVALKCPVFIDLRRVLSNCNVPKYTANLNSLCQSNSKTQVQLHPFSRAEPAMLVYSLFGKDIVTILSFTILKSRKHKYLSISERLFMSLMYFYFHNM